MSDTPTLQRDEALEEQMLKAVIEDRNNIPRSQQVQVGPSQVGGCRELLRVGLFEPESARAPETHWATAAHVGSIMGEDLERIFGQRIGALEQQRVTAHFGELGASISGAIDLLFVQGNMVADLKSCADIASVLYDMKKNAEIIETLLAIDADGLLFRKTVETADGAYELTDALLQKMSKLSYYTQVSIYVMGAIQQGVLEEGASARLVFYDRAGNYQGFAAVVIPSEQIGLFFKIAERRLFQVMEAQQVYESTGGNPATISHLRDMTPSFCFSPKVMCPLRMQCWGGSDWTSDNRISQEHAASVDRYIAGREMEKMGKAMKDTARAELRDVSGILPDGRMISWVRGGSTINVVETTSVATRPVGAILDKAMSVIDKTSEPPTPEEMKATRLRNLKALRKPQLTLIASDEEHQLSTEGTVAELVERIMAHEFPEATAKVEEVPAEPEPVENPVDNEEETVEEVVYDSAVSVRPVAPPMSEVIAYRNDLFNLTPTELAREAHAYGVPVDLLRSEMIQTIIDIKYPSMRPTQPSPEVIASRNRLREMQKASDPAYPVGEGVDNGVRDSGDE